MSTSFSSALFNVCTQVVRDDTLPKLKERAIAGGFITVVCMYCNAFIEDKPGDGVSGLSHGICETCERDVRAEMNLPMRSVLSGMIP